MIEQLKPTNYGSFIDPKGITWDTQKDYLQCEILGLCGCGNPDEVTLYIKEMLEKIKKGEHPDYSNLPAMFFLYWANNKGFAEHGCTIRCSFLTDTGKELLNDINTIIEKSYKENKKP